MSRYRRGGKNGKRPQDRPASALHRQHSSGRLSHWYSHKPVVTVDQLHKYRRKEFSRIAADHSPPSQPEQQQQQQPPPIGLSASPPSFVTEYRCRYEPPYRTAEEMSKNRRHAAVPKDELQVEGEAEFSPEYADQYKDAPRERNVAGRQGSHIGPFVCADDAAPEGLAFRSEQNDRYVPHPDGRRADNLRPGTGLRMDQAPMEGETEQTASYRKYPDTPHPDAAAPAGSVTDDNDMTQRLFYLTPVVSRHGDVPEEFLGPNLVRHRLLPSVAFGLRLFFSLRRLFRTIGLDRDISRLGTRTAAGGSHVRRPAFRLQVVDCSGVTDDDDDDDDEGNNSGDNSGDDGRTTTDAFVVLTRCSDRFRPSSAASVASVGPGRPPDDAPSRPPHHHRHAVLYDHGGGGGNRWVKRRQRKMGTVRFFDDPRDRRPTTVAGKTIQ